MTSEPVTTETHSPAGRVLPLPQKPKKRGHQTPAPTVDPPVAGTQDEPAPHRKQPTAPSAALAGQVVASEQAPVATTSTDKGPARTIYSDLRIDDFLHEIRVEAAVARLDLTHSAVWRLAMHEFIERHTPADVVRHFSRTTSKTGQVGRPRR